MYFKGLPVIISPESLFSISKIALKKTGVYVHKAPCYSNMGAIGRLSLELQFQQA